MRLSEEIDALRHVSSQLLDAAGVPLPAQPSNDHNEADAEAPTWFTTLLRPQTRSDLFLMGSDQQDPISLQISTDPSNEIAEVWEDFKVIMPLLVLTGFTMVGLTIVFNALVMGRLQRVQKAISAIRQGDTTRRAPDDWLLEFASLAEGVNELTAHLHAEQAETKLLQTRLLTVSEAERAKIASDLHDEIGPQIFAMNAALAQAQTAAENLVGESRKQLDEALQATTTHAEAVSDSARTAINDLRPMLAGQGSLLELLEELVADFAEIAPEAEIVLKCDCEVSGPGELAELSIYRFARESVLNALRHGKADRIEISMFCPDAAPRHIVTRIVDNGRGPTEAVKPNSYGVVGIWDRARALGAAYQPPHRVRDTTVTELRMPCR